MFAQQMQTSRCNTVDKMFDRRLQTSPLEHANLENTVLAKPSSVAMKPGMGLNSFISPSAIHPSSLRPSSRESSASTVSAPDILQGFTPYLNVFDVEKVVIQLRAALLDESTTLLSQISSIKLFSMFLYENLGT